MSSAVRGRPLPPEPCHCLSSLMTRIPRNTTARSRNKCCRRKSINITYLCARLCVCLCGCRCTGAFVCLRVCSLTYPPCNAPPYCHLRLLWLYHLYRYILINDMIFGKRYHTASLNDCDDDDDDDDDDDENGDDDDDKYNESITILMMVIMMTNLVIIMLVMMTMTVMY